MNKLAVLAGILRREIKLYYASLLISIQTNSLNTIFPIYNYLCCHAPDAQDKNQKKQTILKGRRNDMFYLPPITIHPLPFTHKCSHCFNSVVFWIYTTLKISTTL